MYEVIHFFTDLQDNSYAYNVGDTFPRIGFAVGQDRLDELMGSDNKQGKPLIKYISVEIEGSTVDTVEDKTETETKAYTKTEIQRMNVAELREVATNLGLENADSMTGVQLKEYLISAYEL